jgi:uncharacterized repeat protein (TIGR01451 family)
VWTVGAVAGVAQAVLSITATVDPGTAGTAITNSAAITASDQTDVDGSNDADSAAVTVQAIDLGVTKIVDDASPNEGDSITYTVTVTNNGPDGATGVEITDLLPTGVTYVSDGPSQGGYTPGTGVWSVGALSNGASATLDLTATVDSGTAGTTVSNTASLTAVDQTDTNGTNDSDSADITVIAVDVAVTKSVDDPAPNEGGAIVYTITATNNGPDMATQIDVTDVLPAGVTYVSDSPSQGTYNSGTGVWDVGNLIDDAFATLAITATVDAGTGGTTIINSAAVTAVNQVDVDPGNDADSASLTVQAIDLAVTKTVDDPAPNEQDTVVFTVTTTNLGPDAATGVVVTDLLPAGFTFVSSAPSQGAYADSTGIWAVGAVAADSAATLDLTATVNAGTAGTTLTNTASLTAADQADANAANDSDSAAVTVQAVDLAVVKTVDDDTPDEGDMIVYTVTVANAGPDAATGVEITDILPADVTWTADSTSQGAYSSGTGIWTVGTLVDSTVATLQVTVMVNAETAGASITNTAFVSSVDQVDLGPANDSGSVVVTVSVTPGFRRLTATPAADLHPTWAPDNSAIVFDSDASGNRDVWSIAPEGGAPVQLTNDSGVDQDPDWSPVSSTIVFSADGGSGQEDLFTMDAAGGSRSFLLGDSTAVERFPVWSPDGSQVAFTRDNDVWVAPVGGGAPLQLTSGPGTENHPSWSPDGTMIAYMSDQTGDNEIWIAPAAGGAATRLTDDPANDSAPSWSPDGTRIAFHSSRSGNNDIWLLPATGGPAVQVTDGAGNNVQPDWAPSGNEIVYSGGGDIWIATLNGVDVLVRKSADREHPAEGATLTWIIEAENRGPDAASNVEVTDLLPPGVTYVGNQTTAGTYAAGTGIWSIGALAAGRTDTLAIVVSVDAGTVDSTITNTASVTSVDQKDGNPFNDTASASVTVISAVSADDLHLAPSVYSLATGRPNPFRDRVTIRFDLPVAGHADLAVFDVTGRRVRTVIRGRLDAGRYAPIWDGRDEHGSRVAAGVYFVRLRAGDFTATRKSVRLD